MKILSKEEIIIEFEKLQTFGKNDILLDEEDINQVLNDKDLVAMGVCEKSSETSSFDAMSSIVMDFEENNLLLNNVDGILINFQLNSSYELIRLVEAMDVIYSKCKSNNINNEPDTIFGVSCNNDLKDDYVKVTMFVGYSKKGSLKYVNNLKGN